MRIAIWYNLPHGGARRALYDQVKGLLARGHTIEAWRPLDETSRSGFADVGELVRQHEVPLAEVPPPGPGRLERLRHRKRAMGDQVAAMAEHSAVCAREIEAGGFDLLFAHQDARFNAPFIGRAVQTLPKALYLQEPHRPLYEAQPDSAWAGHWPHRRLKRPVQWGLQVYHAHHALESQRIRLREEAANAKAFDRILVNSYYSRESVLKAYGPKDIDVRACHLGIDLSRFENRHLPRERFVIGLGEIDYRKNVEGAIRAVATIERDRPPLVWVGNRSVAEYRSRMEALAKELGVELQIETMASDEALLDRLARAGVMIYTPLLEPFGYAPLEANACGLAVVAVAEGGVRETVADGVNGILAAPDPSALGRAIEAVLADSDFGDRAERHVRANWGLDRSIDEVERNLHAILGR